MKKRMELEHQISKAEKEVTKANERLARLRRRLPGVDVEDYTLLDATGAKIRLSSLFSERDELIAIHNMGKGCPYCTLWADGFNGVAKHLQDRAAFVVVSPDPPEEQSKFATSRGWTFKMASAHGTSFAKDLGFQAKDGSYRPGVSVFRKHKNGLIVRVSKAQFGPGDEFCSVWHLFDLLPRGRAGWEPKFTY